MSLRVGSVVIRVDDLARQVAFWSAALDYEVRPGDTDDFVLLRPRDSVGPNVSLDRVRAQVQVPPRIHLDLYAEDQAREVARLSALGATEVHWDKRPPDADYVIMSDPEGNRFCVVDVARSIGFDRATIRLAGEVLPRSRRGLRGSGAPFAV